jgi:hypothetical protein
MPTGHDTHTPATRHAHRRAQQMRTVVVCLPPHTEPRLLPELAHTTLAVHGLTAHGVTPHFIAGTRRAGKLIDRWHGLTSGGPIKLLDLDRMRRHAAAAAAAQWLLWHRVVVGTRPAQPFWSFLDRHRADPRRYPLDRAQGEYAAQPRILAMATFNALPRKPCELPTATLEAFQAGQATYINLAWLAAVPADGLAPAHGEQGGWLTTRSERLTDQLTYLHAANAHLTRLHPSVQLAALAVG